MLLMPLIGVMLGRMNRYRRIEEFRALYVIGMLMSPLVGECVWG
jgi:hypothetical protein